MGQRLAWPALEKSQVPGSLAEPSGSLHQHGQTQHLESMPTVAATFSAAPEAVSKQKTGLFGAKHLQARVLQLISSHLTGHNRHHAFSRYGPWQSEIYWFIRLGCCTRQTIILSSTPITKPSWCQSFSQWISTDALRGQLHLKFPIDFWLCGSASKLHGSMNIG